MNYVLLHNLEKVKLIRKLDTSKHKSNWESLKKNLNLINVNVNIQQPDDPAYVFNAYCPITIRLIQELTSKGWNSIKDDLKKLPGNIIFPENEKEIIFPKKQKQNFIMLIFIGGITYAEIAAVRLLNKMNKNHKFFMLTTHVTSGKKIIEGMRMNFDSNQGLSIKDFSSQLKSMK